MNSINKIVFIIIVGFLFVNCKDAGKEKNKIEGIETTTQKEKSTTIVGKIQTTSFTIEGMSCAVMCAAKIEKELAGQQGVQEAKVDFGTKTAIVKYNIENQTSEKLAKAIEAVAGGELYKVSKVIHDKPA